MDTGKLLILSIEARESQSYGRAVGEFFLFLKPWKDRSKWQVVKVCLCWWMLEEDKSCQGKLGKIYCSWNELKVC